MTTYNFGAGPAMLPIEIMQQAQAELLNWQQCGMSVIEIGHRTQRFRALLEETEKDFRNLLQIPENYHVLFLTCPTRAQFSMVPLNLLGDKKRADYFDTGIWSQQAIREAKRYGDIHCVTSAEASGYTIIPDQEIWKLDPYASYVHYTPNETINGLEFPIIPEVGAIPLVADMTSTIFSQPMDVNRFGVIYAGAQKNIATAGLTLVIIRDDLIGHALPITPTIFNYQIHQQEHSLYHTPNTFSCYIANLMGKWLKQQGGLESIDKQVKRKATKLYTCIDKSNGFYRNPINPSYRSRTNIPFTIHDNALEELFLQQAEQNGLLQLQGHKFVGGLRASLYNAMPEEGVDVLISFMRDFMANHG